MRHKHLLPVAADCDCDVIVNFLCVCVCVCVYVVSNEMSLCNYASVFVRACCESKQEKKTQINKS